MLILHINGIILYSERYQNAPDKVTFVYELTVPSKTEILEPSTGSVMPRTTIATEFPGIWENGDPPIHIKNILLYPGRRIAKIDGKEIRLTRTECNLLIFLYSQSGQVFTREELMRRVWDYPQVTDDCSTVTVHVQRLRKKIEIYPEKPKHIKTVWGEGYMFEAEAAMSW